MLGLGFGEIVVILILGLIFIGPKRLPEAGRKIGEFYRQFRDAAETMKETVTQGLEESDPSTERRSRPSTELRASDDSQHGAD